MWKLGQTAQLELLFPPINYTSSNFSHSRGETGVWARCFQTRQSCPALSFHLHMCGVTGLKGLAPRCVFPQFPHRRSCVIVKTDAFFSAAAGWQPRRETGTRGDSCTAPGSRLPGGHSTCCQDGEGSWRASINGTIMDKTNKIKRLFAEVCLEANTLMSPLRAPTLGK